MDSWETLWTHRPTRSPRAFEPARPQILSVYSAKHPPAKNAAPTCLVPDALLLPEDRILHRIENAFRAGLDSLPSPGPPFPNVLKSPYVSEFECRLSGPITNKGECYMLFAFLLPAVHDVVLPIFESSGYDGVTVKDASSPQTYSQEGDFQMEARAGDTSASVSFDFQPHGALLEYGGTKTYYKSPGGVISGGLQLAQRLNANEEARHGGAMAIRVTPLAIGKRKFESV